MWRVSKIEAKSTLPPCHPAVQLGKGKGSPVDRQSKNYQGWGGGKVETGLRASRLLLCRQKDCGQGQQTRA